jgi:hypothetical protein
MATAKDIFDSMVRKSGSPWDLAIDMTNHYLSNYKSVSGEHSDVVELYAPYVWIEILDNVIRKNLNNVQPSVDSDEFKTYQTEDQVVETNFSFKDTITYIKGKTLAKREEWFMLWEEGIKVGYPILENLDKLYTDRSNIDNIADVKRELGLTDER